MYGNYFKFTTTLCGKSMPPGAIANAACKMALAAGCPYNKEMPDAAVLAAGCAEKLKHTGSLAVQKDAVQLTPNE